MADPLAENNKPYDECTPPPSSFAWTLTQNGPEADTLRIDKIIDRKKAPHADIYSVFDEGINCLAENVEAHVFNLDNDQPKLRKHRLRCIKRMEGRTILRKTVEFAEVVVITTSSGPSSHLTGRKTNEDTDRGSLIGPSVPHMKHQSRSQMKEKTASQREATRTRQRERRNARRLDRRRHDSSDAMDDERGSGVSSRALNVSTIYVSKSTGSLRQLSF